MIPPGAWLGLLGGGQLGRMFTMAAQSMGYKVVVLDPGSDSPAGSVADDHIAADYLDPGALQELATRCAAATTEFENVPADALRFLAQHCTVSPSADSVAVAQDRIAEKSFLASAGIEVAPHRAVRGEQDLDDSVTALLPGILKRSRLGYDGKGQARVTTVDEARSAFVRLGAQPCVLERVVPLELELSVVVARGFDGSAVTWTVTENQHAHGILEVSIVPARVADTLAERARSAALRVASQLDYRGVLCVEFFVLRDGRLLANEIAPRPHNSGHYTIDACVTSQFEQQVRVLCRLPLGSTQLHCPAVMVNLLGDLWAGGEPRWEHVLRHPGAKLHLYGKAQPRPGRKMGHYTVLADSREAALAVAMQAKSLLLSEAQEARLKSA
ncbi:MAG TPA: 5-(carboxyamino)imidazole ribonucleotide synthase [Burkholderiales bacterium]|nr:5-(carboxyamino)imidazole ribonucleotide synthase [Burkholderiales bacterium]